MLKDFSTPDKIRVEINKLNKHPSLATAYKEYQTLYLDGRLDTMSDEEKFAVNILCWFRSLPNLG